MFAEQYVEVFEVTEYRDGAVFRTKSHGHQWVPLGEKPPTGWLYVAPSDEFSKTNPVVRMKKGGETK